MLVNNRRVVFAWDNQQCIELIKNEKQILFNPTQKIVLENSYILDSINLCFDFSHQPEMFYRTVIVP